MKNIEFYYDEIYKLETFPRVLEFAQEKGFIPKIRTTAMQDVLTWLNEEQQVLDETEKRYLRNIIMPLKTEYTYLQKKHCNFNDAEYIRIGGLKGHTKGEIECIEMPFFKAGTMYKEMEQDRKYSLEELGL